MPDLDTAMTSLLQAAYTIGMRDGVNAVLNHLPAGIREPAAQAMLADGSAARARLSDHPERIDEIAELQKEIAQAIETGQASRN